MKFAEGDAEKLAQAMYDALVALGFDSDGDDTPAAWIAGSGVDGFIQSFIDEVTEFRAEAVEMLNTQGGM